MHHPRCQEEIPPLSVDTNTGKNDMRARIFIRSAGLLTQLYRNDPTPAQRLMVTPVAINVRVAVATAISQPFSGPDRFTWERKFQHSFHCNG